MVHRLVLHWIIADSRINLPVSGIGLITRAQSANRSNTLKQLIIHPCAVIQACRKQPWACEPSNAEVGHVLLDHPLSCHSIIFWFGLVCVQQMYPEVSRVQATT